MMVERREFTRGRPGADGPLARLHLRTGHDLSVIDISQRGARVEGAVRLLPGTGVDVHVVSAERHLRIRSRVMRSQVRRLTARAIAYESGLLFEVSLDEILLLTHCGVPPKLKIA